MERMDMEKDRVTTLKEEINSRWRKNLFHICVILAAIGTVTEIVIYMVDARLGVLFLPKLLYQFRFIYIPSSLNILVAVITYKKIHSPKLQDNAKNIWSCVLIYFLCANTQFIHYVYGPLLMLPVISIFVSIMFGNRKLTRSMTIASLVSLSGAVFMSAIELRKDDPQLVADAFLAVLVMLVAQIAASLLISYVNEQFESLSNSNRRVNQLIEEIHLDPLMGINNRMALNEKVEECIAQEWEDNACHLLMLDIDDFKNVNDTYGHLCGDEVLIQLSDTIRKFTGRTVNAFRYGGEEIMIITTRETLDETYARAEKLRLAFYSLKYDFAPNLSISFSGGIATLRKGQTADEWIAQADSALYEAKRLGKNRIVCQNKK